MAEMSRCPRKPHREWHVVGSAVRFEAVEKPQTLLGIGRGEDEDLLIGRSTEPARATRDRRSGGSTVIVAAVPRICSISAAKVSSVGAAKMVRNGISALVISRDPGDELSRQKRVASEEEEVVVQPDPFDLEHLLPDLGQRALELGSRWDVFRVCPREVIRCRQRLAVDLAVGSQRKRFERHECGRDHVIRQGALQKCAQLSGGGCRRAGSDVRDESPVTGVFFAGDNDRVPHRLMPSKRGLDLAQLDPEPSDLHLLIGPTEVLDITVRQVACDVAGTVDARTPVRVEWIGHEPLLGEVWASAISARKPSPSDPKLAWNADRNRLHPLVKDI